MSRVNAPQPRVRHAAFFTGATEMIVWGGEERWDGGVYDAVEDRWSLGSAPIGEEVLVAPGPGATPAHAAIVRGYRIDAQPAALSVDAFPSSPGSGAIAAAGRVCCSVADALLVAPGPGPSNPPEVRGFDRLGAPLPGLDVVAYGAPGYGARVGSGEIDGRAELLTGPGPSLVYGPHVRAFRYDGTVTTPIAKVSFFAYGTLRYGVNVAATRLDPDAFDEIVTGAGPGAVFGPHVRGWNVDAGPVAPLPGAGFFAYGTLRYGVEVAGGDVDGDGFGEIVTGPGPSKAFGSHLRAFDVDGGVASSMPGVNAQVIPGATHGLNVAAGDLDRDGDDEIAVGAGPDPAFGSRMRALDVDGASLVLIPGLDLDPFGLSHGLRVAAGEIGR